MVINIPFKATHLWKVVVFILIMVCLDSWRVIAVADPLKQGMQIIAENMALWWNLPESEGGGGGKPLDQLDIRTFFRYPIFIKSLGNWDSNINNRTRTDTNLPDNIYIISQYGTYYINMLPPDQIQIIGTRRAARRLGVLQAETCINLSRNSDSPKITLKYKLFHKKSFGII